MSDKRPPVDFSLKIGKFEITLGTGVLTIIVDAVLKHFGWL